MIQQWTPFFIKIRVMAFKVNSITHLFNFHCSLSALSQNIYFISLSSQSWHIESQSDNTNFDSQIICSRSYLDIIYHQVTSNYSFIWNFQALSILTWPLSDLSLAPFWSVSSYFQLNCLKLDFWWFKFGKMSLMWS